MATLMTEQHREIWRIGPDGQLSLVVELDGSGFTLQDSNGTSIDLNPPQARAVVRLMRKRLDVADEAPFPDPELEPKEKPKPVADSA